MKREILCLTQYSNQIAETEILLGC